MMLKKWGGNPILSPNPDNDWEKMAVLNPGVWYENGKINLLYRASGEIEDYVIHLGLAESEDGFNFKRVSDKPVFSPSHDGFDAGCVEDPRIVKFEDTYYITYAARACPPVAFWSGRKRDNLPSQGKTWVENLTRSGLAATKDFRSFERLGTLTGDDVDDRDVVLFPEKINGKYVMLRRPAEWVGENYGTEKPATWITYSDDLKNWDDCRLLFKSEFAWEKDKVGAGSVPIKTEYGWLILYHGVADEVYRVGVMMLDLNDPSIVIARCPYFIMEPEEEFEKNGFIDNVVFPCGTAVIGDELFVYYGAADTVCCLATVNFNELLDYVMNFKI